MTQHCKTCRRDLEPSAYETDYKTCSECRTKKARTPPILSLSECKTIAEDRGGECLSTEYKNGKTKMKWRCNLGHEWEAIFESVKHNKHWCPSCGKKKIGDSTRLDLKHCQDFAKSRGGACLSTEYKNTGTKMKWCCNLGHEWMSHLNNIKTKNWCPICAGNQKLSLSECKTIAEARGGECLSTEYKNSGTKMKWRCNLGHEWEAVFSEIKNGKTWCPQCSSSRTEKLCRNIFEKLLLKPFPTKRPQWLEKLELDGYNEELNIAFEYNGIQHYKYNTRFHNNNPEEFELQKQRDIKKYALCRTRGIKLIIIPYQYDYQNPTELENFIVAELSLCKEA